MIVCHCKGTTDRQIHAAIACGAKDGEAVGQACGGSGMICGGCRPTIQTLLREAARKQAKAQPITSVA